MAFFNWTDDLGTGNMRIDADHKHLVNLLNTLYDAMKAGKGNEVLGKILDELIQYTTTHFSREEALMQQIAYAHFAEHKAEHTKLVSAVMELQAKFKAGATTLSVAAFHFLSDWLRNHIRQNDVKLGLALKASR